MNWFTTFVFYMGLVDAGVVMATGIVVAAMFLMGKEVQSLFERVGPAIAVLIGSNIAAALILWGTKALTAPGV